MVNVHNEAKYAIAASDYRCLACAEEVACEALYYSAVTFGDGAFQRRNYCVGCWKRSTTPEPEDHGTRNGLDAFASWRSRRPVAPSERPGKIRFDPQLAMQFFLRLGEEAFSATELDSEGDSLPEAEQPERDRGENPEPPEDGELTRPADQDAAQDVAGAAVEEEDAVAEDVGVERPERANGCEREQLRFFIALLLVRKKALKFKSSIDRGGRELLLLVDRETPPRVHEVLNPGLSEGQLERLKERLGELLQMQI